MSLSWTKVKIHDFINFYYDSDSYFDNSKIIFICLIYEHLSTITIELNYFCQILNDKLGDPKTNFPKQQSCFLGDVPPSWYIAAVGS